MKKRRFFLMRKKIYSSEQLLDFSGNIYLLKILCKILQIKQTHTFVFKMNLIG